MSGPSVTEDENVLTPRQAFHLGFVARCARDGVPPERVPALAKEAADKVAGFLGDVVGAVKGVTSPALAYGLPLALAAPPLVGGLAGYGLARATDVDDTDVDEIKDQELLSAYAQETDRLRRQRAMRDYQKAVQGGARRLRP